MSSHHKPQDSSPPIANSFLESVGAVGMQMPSNSEAYQTALAILKPALIMLSLPDIQKTLKREEFRFEVSASWVTGLAGDCMFEKANNDKDRLVTRLDYAWALLSQLPEKMGLGNEGGGALLRGILQSHADSLKLCVDRHMDGSGNLELVDPVAAAENEISRLEAMLAGKLGLAEMSVVGRTHDGGTYKGGGFYLINQFDPETRSPR